MCLFIFQIPVCFFKDPHFTQQCICWNGCEWLLCFHTWYSVKCCSLSGLEWLDSGCLADSLPESYPVRTWIRTGKTDLRTMQLKMTTTLSFSLWMLSSSILAVIFVLTGIMENVLASQKRRLENGCVHL